MTKQIEPDGMQWNCKEVYISKQEWVKEVWGNRWKEVIIKTSGVSRPITWDGWVITRKEKISPEEKRIGGKCNTVHLLSSAFIHHFHPVYTQSCFSHIHGPIHLLSPAFVHPVHTCITPQCTHTHHPPFSSCAYLFLFFHTHTHHPYTHYCHSLSYTFSTCIY